MAENDILVSVENHIAVVTFNRPEKLNAVTGEMAQRFLKIIAEMRSDDNVKVVIVTGAGSAFCSGADLSSLVETKRQRWELIRPIGYQVLALTKLEKPTIAAINGVAAGIGLSMALACDIRLASENARLAVIWIKRGLVADGGTTYFLTRLLGISKALEIMLMSETIGAVDAERMGLVSKTIRPDSLMTVAKEMARKLAEGPSVAIELTKKAGYRALESSLESQLEFETYAQNLCFQTEDYKEGIKSFMEKRPPQFKGC